MRTKKFVLVLAIVLIAMLAFMPVAVQAQALSDVPIPVDVISVVVSIVLGFASLIGVSALIAVLVNLLKVIKIVKDGTSAQWAAGLNLLAFIALVAFGVFRPDLTMEILNGYAGQIATVLLFVLGFITQMTGSKPVYDQLKAAKAPLIYKSFSAIKDA